MFAVRGYLEISRPTCRTLGTHNTCSFQIWIWS